MDPITQECYICHEKISGYNQDSFDIAWNEHFKKHAPVEQKINIDVKPVEIFVAPTTQNKKSRNK